MEEIKELKAQAYDLIAGLELKQSEMENIRKELNLVNSKIAALLKEKKDESS